MNASSRSRGIVGAGAALLACILIVGSGSGALAAQPLAHSHALAAADDRSGPQFYSGASVDVSGTIHGDVYAAGQSVTISGDVTGDVIAAAQTVTVTGTVDGNVRLAGQDVTISGDVSRSGTVFASTVVIDGSGAIGADLVAAAGDIRIAGDVGRDVFASASRLSIPGSVGGDLTYASDNPATIADGAVAGNVQHVKTSQPRTVAVSPWAALLAWFLGVVYSLVALSLIAVLAGLLIPRWLRRVTDHLVPSPWKALLVGFVACLAIGPAVLFLLVSIVGAPLALAALLIWTVITLATFVYGAYYLGRLVLRGPQHAVLKTFVGGLILIVGLQIPWLNILVWIAMVLFGVGAQLLEFHRQRPWSTPAEPGGVRAAPEQASADLSA